MVSTECPSCHSTSVEFDSAKGDAVCTNCGHVLEESAIVHEVGFAQGDNGVSSVVGQFVPEQGVRGGSRFGGLSGQRESKEQTRNNGKREIKRIAPEGLSQNLVDSAVRFFNLAVQHNFIQGRRLQHVAAACLYIVCRRERTSHMLLDFAEQLSVNVYVLGAVFLKLCRSLSLRLPIVDPSLYIHRFAARLDFGNKTHAVALTALRLVAGMKRDWMTVGRRPAGICGACLYVASKVHGFHRSVSQIVAEVRVCEATVKRRLEEFEDTPGANLNAKQYENYDPAIGCDPPSFQRRKKELEEEAAKLMQKSAELRSLGGIESQSSTAASQALTQARVPAVPQGAASTSEENLASAADNGKGGDEGDEEALNLQLSEAELRECLHTDAEAKAKVAIWRYNNQEYLKKEKEKEAKAAEDAAQGNIKKPVRQKRGRPSERMPETPGQAVMQELVSKASKRVSSKINYARLEQAFDATANPIDPKEGSLASLKVPRRG